MEHRETKGRKTITKNHKIVYAFLFIECLCYFVFLYLDIFQGTNGTFIKASLWLKWCSVLGCFSFVAFHQPVEYRKKEKSVVSAALFFTVIADFFLLLTDWYIIGVLCFIITHTIYLYRLSMWNEEISFKKRIAGRLLCGCAIFLFVVLVAGIRNMGFLAVAVYFSSLVDNITVSASIYFYHVGSKRKSGCFFIGLCLLFLCDVQVAICNADMVISVWEMPIILNLITFATVATWMFYLPSQVLLALSGRLEK